VPDTIDDDTAAGLLMQGLTAQHLAEHAEPVHSVAGGVGSLLAQLLSGSDHTVIGRVSFERKAAAARRAGTRHVVVDREGRFVAQVSRFTRGQGVRAVFDGTGAETYRDSLASLAMHGVYAYYGGADGQPEPVWLAELWSTAGSGTTRPPRPLCEDLIRAAKDTGLTNLPLQGFDANRIWVEIVCLATELTAWMQMLAKHDHTARGWEPKRLRLLSAAGRLTRHARRTRLRFATHWPWSALITTALTRLQPG
jgi:hypothetical protein